MIDILRLLQKCSDQCLTIVGLHVQFQLSKTSKAPAKLALFP